MFPPNKPYVPTSISEIIDYLGSMMIESPSFADITGYFPYKNLDNTFSSLNNGLAIVRENLSDTIYHKLIEMSDRMRAHFEADPEDKTDDGLKGRDIIMEMQDILKRCARGSRQN